jgi:hypothetical protein
MVIGDSIEDGLINEDGEEGGAELAIGATAGEGVVEDETFVHPLDPIISKIITKYFFFIDLC